MNNTKSRPLLTQDEFNQLCQDIHSPDLRLRKIARDEILLANTGLVYKEVRKALKNRPAYMSNMEMDLFNEGAVGLMRAIEKFDPSRDNQFSTYAVPWIRQGVRRCADRNTTVVKVPGAEVSSARLAIANGDKVRSGVAEAMSPVRIIEGFDMASSGPSVEDLVLESEGVAALALAIDSLSEDHQYVIRRKFKFAGYEDLSNRTITSNKSIGEELNVSTGEVTRLYLEALEKLRAVLADQ